MENLYKKILQFSSRGNLSIQNRLKKKELLDQMKAILDQKKEETKTSIHSSVDNARLWMEEFTGLDKVHAAQSDVFRYQAEFIQSQSKRRELGTQLASLQSELNELHNDIVTTDRRDEKYLQLITREHKLLKMENQLRNNFVLTEAEERENFTLFTTKIRESQDKEREQALRTKYWTIIVSSAVTVIGVLGNGLISFLKMHKMDKTIVSLGDETKQLNQSIHSNINQLDVSQAQVIALLTQIVNTVKPQTSNSAENRNNSVDAVNRTRIEQSLVELLREANSKLDVLKESKSDSVFNRIDAGQTEMMHSLMQIRDLIENQVLVSRLKDDRKSKAHLKELKEKESVIGERQVLESTERLNRSGSGMASDSGLEMKSTVTSTGASTQGGLGSGAERTGSSRWGILGSPGWGTKRTSSESGMVRGEGLGDGVIYEGDNDSNETDDDSWTQKLVYFGVFTCVLVLLGRVVS